MLTYPEVVKNPQVQYMQTFRTISGAPYGDIKIVGNPIQFSETPVTYRIAPPCLGQHNREILAELGCTEEEIERLAQKRVIQMENPATFRI